jgi:alpha-glucosidase
MELLPSEGPLLRYERRYGNEVVLCIFNMGQDPVEVEPPAGNWEVLEGHGFESILEGNRINLPAWGAFFARRA